MRAQGVVVNLSRLAPAWSLEIASADTEMIVAISVDQVLLSIATIHPRGATSIIPPQEAATSPTFIYARPTPRCEANPKYVYVGDNFSPRFLLYATACVRRSQQHTMEQRVEVVAGTQDGQLQEERPLACAGL